MSKVHLKVKDNGWKAFKKQMKELEGEPYVKVGVLGSTARSDGISNVELAVIQEFGTKDGHIPSRPFLRGTMERQKRAWQKLIEKLLWAILLRRISTTQALELLGQQASADVRRTITDTIDLAPNAPSTIKGKGSSRPLIHRGQLLNSISYEVVE